MVACKRGKVAHHRWGWLIALMCLACASDATLVLDLPAGMFAPKDVASVKLVVRAQGQESSVAAELNNGQFDFGDLPAYENAQLEVSLLDSLGALRGYGRLDAVDLSGDSTLTMAIRRPMVFLSNGIEVETGATSAWVGAPASAVDVSTKSTTGKAGLSLNNHTIRMVALGAEMYALEQTLGGDNIGTGQIALRKVSADALQFGAPLQVPSIATGGVTDAVGTPLGRIVIATTTGVWVVRPQTGSAILIANGGADRVSVTRDDEGGLEVLALRNRTNQDSACTNQTLLLRLRLVNDKAVEATLQTGTFSDVTTHLGVSLVADICAGTVLRVSGSTLAKEKDLPGEHPWRILMSGTSVWVTSTRSVGENRIALLTFRLGEKNVQELWGTSASHLVEANGGLQRTLNATQLNLNEATLVAGSHVGIRASIEYFAARPPSVNWPSITAIADRMWVITGGALHSTYESWCDTDQECMSVDVCDWRCTADAAVVQPAAGAAHRIRHLSTWFEAR